MSHHRRVAENLDARERRRRLASTGAPVCAPNHIISGHAAAVADSRPGIAYLKNPTSRTPSSRHAQNTAATRAPTSGAARHMEDGLTGRPVRVVPPPLRPRRRPGSRSPAASSVDVLPRGRSRRRKRPSSSSPTHRRPLSRPAPLPARHWRRRAPVRSGHFQAPLRGLACALRPGSAAFKSGRLLPTPPQGAVCEKTASKRASTSAPHLPGHIDAMRAAAPAERHMQDFLSAHCFAISTPRRA